MVSGTGRRSRLAARILNSRSEAVPSPSCRPCPAVVASPVQKSMNVLSLSLRRWRLATRVGSGTPWRTPRLLNPWNRYGTPHTLSWVMKSGRCQRKLPMPLPRLGRRLRRFGPGTRPAAAYLNLSGNPHGGRGAAASASARAGSAGSGHAARPSERAIRAIDPVLDPFAGCATCCVAAAIEGTPICH